MSTPPRVYQKLSHLLSKPLGYTGFWKRIDPTKKTLKLSKNYIHLEYTRFIEICGEVKGLKIDDALLQLATNNKQIKNHFQTGLHEFIVTLKEGGFDLSKTYLLDAYVKDSHHGMSKKFIKECLRGRGRYGATPQAKVCRLEMVFQERDVGFKVRDEDPLEWIRIKLRNGRKPFVETAEEIYKRMRMQRPIKEVITSQSQSLNISS